MEPCGAAAGLGPRALALTQTITSRWLDQLCVVAATGPSLTSEVADACRGHHCIAVNDAYRLFDFAEVLYASDAAWWDAHRGCPGFGGEKWSAHEARANEKRATAAKYSLNLVAGMFGVGFSLDHAIIHYGSNSGFQAINLAILLGANPIVLVGFDMTAAGRPRHFFGDHPKPLKNTGRYERFIPAFRDAAKMLPPWTKIINATPGSRLDCFPMMPLSEALKCA
jgi:hypothetical protein